MINVIRRQGQTDGMMVGRNPPEILGYDVLFDWNLDVFLTGGRGGRRMPRRRLRLEMVDEDGDRITLIIEGNLTREKVLQVADLIELYGGHQERTVPLENKLVRLARAVERRLASGPFTSRDAVEAYREEYGEEISLSTASTYLARLTERGFLEREPSPGGAVRYRLARQQVEG